MDVPYNMAAVYQAQGRYDDAIKILQDLLKKTEKSDNSYARPTATIAPSSSSASAWSIASRRTITAAVETFRKMLPLGDENARTGYQEIIDTYREAKQWPQATAAAKEAVQKMPDDRDLRMVLDAQLADTGDPTKPSADVRSMLKGRPEDREVYLRLAIMYTRAKRWSDAEEALAKAEQLSTKPDDKDYVYFLRGDLYRAPEDVRPGRSRVQESVLTAHRSAERCHSELSWLHECRSRREARGVSQLHQAGFDLEPNNGAYLDSLGWVYFKLGKYDLAEENLTKAVAHGFRPHRAGASRRSLPENRPPETGRRPLGARRRGMEQNRSCGSRHRSLVAKQKKLDAAKVNLAKEESGKQ